MINDYELEQQRRERAGDKEFREKVLRNGSLRWKTNMEIHNTEEEMKRLAAVAAAAVMFVAPATAHAGVQDGDPFVVQAGGYYYACHWWGQSLLKCVRSTGSGVDGEAGDDYHYICLYDRESEVGSRFFCAEDDQPPPGGAAGTPEEAAALQGAVNNMRPNPQPPPEEYPTDPDPPC